jgi:hypothetical protein
MGIIAILCAIVWLVLTVQQRLAAGKHVRLAEQRAGRGDWELAAASLKSALLERLDSPTAVRDLTGRLTRLYAEHGVEADLRRVHDCPRLIKQIWDSKASPEKKGGLTGDLYRETAELLEAYP